MIIIKGCSKVQKPRSLTTFGCFPTRFIVEISPRNSSSWSVVGLSVCKKNYYLIGSNIAYDLHKKILLRYKNNGNTFSSTRKLCIYKQYHQEKVLTLKLPPEKLSFSFYNEKLKAK
jgi:hypothetical protein